MPAKTTTPTEFVKKEAVLIDEFLIKNIFINHHDKPYISITYELKDTNGRVIGEKSIKLEGTAYSDYVSKKQVLYNDIKNEAYALGKQEGIIPDDAGVV